MKPSSQRARVRAQRLCRFVLLMCAVLAADGLRAADPSASGVGVRIVGSGAAAPDTVSPVISAVDNSAADNTAADSAAANNAAANKSETTIVRTSQVTPKVKLICRSNEAPTGSHIGHRRCRTPAQIDSDEQKAQETIDIMQHRGEIQRATTGVTR